MTTYQFYRELGDQNMVEITIKWKNCVKMGMMCFYNIYYCCVLVFFYCNRCANINKFWHDPSTIPASQWFVIGTLTAYNFIANIIILWLRNCLTLSVLVHRYFYLTYVPNTLTYNVPFTPELNRKVKVVGCTARFKSAPQKSLFMFV